MNWNGTFIWDEEFYYYLYQIESKVTTQRRMSQWNMKANNVYKVNSISIRNYLKQKKAVE